MATNTVFIIYDTAGLPIAAIQPNTLNGPDGVQQSSDLSLFGLGYPTWGQSADQNDYRLLENFACPQSILNPVPLQPMGVAELGDGNGINVPVIGQLWFNTTTQSLFTYTSGGWVGVSIGSTPGPTPPPSPVVGELWYNTVTPQLEVWNGTAWVSVAALYLPLAGNVGNPMTGSIDLGSNNISNVAVLTVGAIQMTALQASNGVTSNQISIPVSGAATILDGPRIGTNIIYHTGNLASPTSYSQRMIVLWYGAAFAYPAGPNGWAICDGGTYNGIATPNMTNRYAIGVGTQASLGQAVGSFTPTGLTLSTGLASALTGSVAGTVLTIAQMPVHNHTLFGGEGSHPAGSGAHYADCFNATVMNTMPAGPNIGTQLIGNTGSSASHTHTYSINAAHTHTVTGGNSVPPSIGMYYIMFVGP